MSTRGILAVVDGDDLIGVFHQYESYPWNLGNRMLLSLVREGGDLDGAIRRWIRDVPGGWLTLDERRREDEDDPEFWRRADLAGQGWIEWTYLFDPAARSLRVWPGNPALDETWDRPDWTLHIGGDGRADPPVFSAPEALWHALPVDAGWDSDSERAHASRQTFVQALRARVADEPSFAEAVESALSAAIDRLEWLEAEPAETPEERDLRDALGLPRPASDPPGDSSLRVSFFGLAAQVYWATRIGQHEVCFPSGACFRQDFDPLHLWRADGRHAVLDLADALPLEMYAPIVEAAAFARLPGDWELQDDNLFLFRTVVPDAEATDPGRHIGFTKARELDPECQLADALGTSERHPPLQWLVPEWLRLRQVTPQ